ncbi:discoidin domain-containing protein [Actinokineospora diospyrosa]|uniref:F5/8 type C domain-containing protein n=1 Tax=Actinokineospora diospyrosa TaxID=103728 RepID=A0ABT1ICQ1_9PSEU|nr:discoidin domain-containing protein [Actinokineospora diospyrosa]MCP2270136.1 hypothetical protein [Actinokineospora diospyrosa]
MRLLARTHVLPAALALASIALIGVLVPVASAGPRAEGSSDVLLTTFPPSSPPSTTGTWDPCYQGPPSSPPSGTTYLATPTQTVPTSNTMPSAPSSPRPPQPGENFALSGVARSSSNLTNYYLPGKVNDGNVGTAANCQYAWVSANRGLDNIEWVSVTWPDLRSVSHVVVYNTLGLETRDFDIQLLNENGRVWDTVATYNNNTNTVVKSWFGARTTRGVRILVKVGTTASPSIARVNEIQAFAY